MSQFRSGLYQASTSRVDRIRYGDVEYGYTKSYTGDYPYKATEDCGAVSRRDLKTRRRAKAN